jgi:hypothetical protein
MPNERRKIKLRHFTVVRGSLAISRRLKPIYSSSGSPHGGSGSILGGTSQGLLRPVEDLATSERMSVGDPDGIARNQLLVAQPGGRVARCRCPIAGVSSPIAGPSNIYPMFGRPASLWGGVVAKVTSGPMHRSVPTTN